MITTIFRTNTVPSACGDTLGYEILFSIPIVGFIVLLVFSFGGTKNVNLRNFARSYFCFLIVIVIFAIIVAIIGGAAAVGAAYY